MEADQQVVGQREELSLSRSPGCKSDGFGSILDLVDHFEYQILQILGILVLGEGPSAPLNHGHFWGVAGSLWPISATRRFVNRKLLPNCHNCTFS